MTAPTDEQLPGCAKVLGFLLTWGLIGLAVWLVWQDWTKVREFLFDFPEVTAAVAIVCLLGIVLLVLWSALLRRQP